jgi:transcriptional regulator with XRE-family HTH domain
MTGDRPTVLYSGRREIVLTSLAGGPEIDSVRAILAVAALLLRQAREKLGVSAVSVADRCGVSPSVLCRVELGRRVPRLVLVLAMCNVLGLRFSDVMRAAEDEAFPLGNHPWTDDPRDLLAPLRPDYPIVSSVEKGDVG